MKKLVSLVLAAMLVLALVPFASAEDVVKLTWAQGTGADAPVDNAMVLEKLNEISREKIGVECDIQYFTSTQLTNAVLSGETYDMYFTCTWFFDYVTNARDGIFADITEAVKTVTPDLYATMNEDVWNLSAVGGKIYMIPVKKDIGYQCYFTYNKDFYDSIGMTWPEQVSTYAEITPYLKAYAENKPGEYPIQLAGNFAGIDMASLFVGCGSTLGFNVNDPEAKLHSLYEDEQFIDRLNTVHEWYEAGYINPDAATATTVPSKLDTVKVEAAWDGYDFSNSYGYTAGMCKIGNVFLAASTVRVGNALNAALEEDPDRLAAALKYQELVNTDKEYRDILRYGVPGVHFNYEEDGAVAMRTEQGKNNYSPWGFAQGSYVISALEGAPGVTQDLHQWEKAYASYDKALVAPDKGFAFDDESVEAIATEISVIVDKYYKELVTGTLPGTETCAKIMEEMEAAGLRDLQAEMQRQYDEFIAGESK